MDGPQKMRNKNDTSYIILAKPNQKNNESGYDNQVWFFYNGRIQWEKRQYWIQKQQIYIEYDWYEKTNFIKNIRKITQT